MSREKIETILNEFGKNVEISNMCFDENGYCCLSFDDIFLNLEIDEKAALLFMYSNLGEIPFANREGFYEKLLEANYLYLLTGGGIIGIDKASNRVVLAYQTPYMEVTYIKFEKIIENFIKIAEYWIDEIKNFDQSVPDKKTDDQLVPDRFV